VLTDYGLLPGGLLIVAALTARRPMPQSEPGSRASSCRGKLYAECPKKPCPWDSSRCPSTSSGRMDCCGFARRGSVKQEVGRSSGAIEDFSVPATRLAARADDRRREYQFLVERVRLLRGRSVACNRRFSKRDPLPV